MRDMTRSAAGAYVDQAAMLAVDPLRQNDADALQHLAHSLSQLPHIGEVRVLDANGTLVASALQPTDDDSREIQHLRHVIVAPDAPGRVIGTLLVDVDSDTSLLSQHTNIFDTLLWLGIAMLLAILLSWQQARWISAPLRRLSEAMRGLGRIDRPLSVRVTDDSEIGDLQRGFNTAAATLHELHRDMERRIEEATEELAHKNAALEQASKAKARFLAGATHDLRQPLYALTLFSSALGERETDPERLDRIAHVQQCIESLDRLFGELLDLSRLEAGAMQPELRDFPLDELFQEVSRNFRIQAEKQDLRLITRPTDLWVYSDRTMLSRILNNLVSNALRYTHEGGVLLGARRRDGHVRIDVRDTGVGIAEEHQQHIFEEFYRIEDSEHYAQHALSPNAVQRGLGLGLSTVKRLSELLGAECTLHSSPGRGSLFTLKVPTSRVQSAKPAVIGRNIRRLTAPSKELEGTRVLVVDDDQAILAGVHDLLCNWGCRVQTATSCESAMAQARVTPQPPDMIITDLHLGRQCDGVSLLEQLENHYDGTGNGNPPFARLLITGETERSRLQRALARKLPILFKPVPAEPLREALIALLRSHRASASGTVTPAG